MKELIKRRSKFLSLVLRHQPEKIDLVLDDQGWAIVVELIDKMNVHGQGIDDKLLKTIVHSNDKKRFTFNEDYTKIRANQGHSIEIDLALTPTQAPQILYHGTAERFLDSIFANGLDKRSRQHVHLSANIATASSVGKRHGKLVLLEVASAEMEQAGFEFYVSKNGVWLTKDVPKEYLKRLTISVD